MSLVPLEHSPADQGTLVYPAVRQSILVWLVGNVMAQGLIPSGCGGCWHGVWPLLGCGISLSNVLLHVTCVSEVLVPCWTPHYKAISGLADDLKGVWIECSAEFVSLVLLDKDFITQFDAGGTGTAVCLHKLYSQLSVQHRDHVLHGHKHGRCLNQGSSPWLSGSTVAQRDSCQSYFEEFFDRQWDTS